MRDATAHLKASAKNFRAFARFMRVSFVVNMMAAAEYRANFVLQSFGMILNNAAFAIFWKVLIDRSGGVGGYGFSDIMFVWGLVSSAFGLAHVVFGNIRSLGRIVMEGELDGFLLQPRDVFLNVLASRSVVSAWGDLAYGFIVLALLPGFTAEKLALFVSLTCTGALVVTGVFAGVESLVFFVGNSSSFSQAATEFLLSFSLYPETIHGASTRWLLYSLVPAGFVAFVPLRVFTGLRWPLLPALAFAGLAYVGLAYLLFRRGLARYESGNLMGTRL